LLSNEELELIDKKKFDFNRDCILINKDEFQRMEMSQKEMTSFLDFNFDIVKIPASINLLKAYINDDRIFNHFIKQLEKGINMRLTISSIGDDNSHGSSFTIGVTDLIRSINKLVKDDKITLNEIEQNRFNRYLEMTNLYSLAEKFKGQLYTAAIDNNPVKIDTKDIISLIINDTYFESFFDVNKSDKTYKNMPKEWFAYAMIDFIRKELITSKYYLPEKILSNLRKLNSMEVIDYQSLNQINEIRDEFVDDVKIDKGLKKFLLKEMPQGLSDLEKAIYLYIKLCKTLTYDPEFYAVDQKGEIARKHEDINRISNINIKNNYVVCYEFNAIYGKLLSELGINFFTTKPFTGKFGGGHVYLTFRYEKYLIDAEPAFQILNGDMSKAKLNKPLEGLSCINYNQNTKNQFNKIVCNVYKIIIKQEEKKIMNELIEKQKIESLSFDDLITKYRNLTNFNYTKISLDKKVDILIEKIISSNFKEMDAISYLMQLKQIIFSEEERLFHFNMTVIRENLINSNFEAIPTTIFTINKKNINIDNKNNVYFSYNQINGLKTISKDQIEQLFNNGTYSYIESKDCKIPGIEFESEIKNDRRI
jgi:hypothetical protein